MDIQKIENLIKPLIEQSGFQLYDLEFHGRTLRVCIHKDDGIGINDCAEVSRLINPALDVDDLIPGSYDLEVSSPGLDRELRKPNHFETAVGEVIHVVTSQTMEKWNEKQNGEDKFFEKRKKVKGQLKSFGGDHIIVECDTREVKIPLEIISRSYVDFELVKQEKKGKKVQNGR